MKMSAKKPKGALFAFEAAGTQAGWRTFMYWGGANACCVIADALYVLVFLSLQTVSAPR